MSDRKTPPPVPRAGTNREVFRPKTPAAGVAAQIAAPRPTWDEKTDPHAPLLDQINQRTQKISHTAESSLKRFEDLEAGHEVIKKRLDAQDTELATVKQAVAYTKGKIDAIAENAEAQMQERRERAAAAAAAQRERLAHELAKTRIRARAKMVGGVLGGLAALIAAIAALLQVL